MAMLDTLLAGRYKILRTLGAGGFGQTYLVEDLGNPDRPKRVVKQLKPSRQDSDFLAVARRLFDTEVLILQRLGQHEQIPELFDHFEENQEFYLVEEFVEGQQLSDILSQGKRLGEAAVVDLLRDVLTALRFIHTNHVIHRDIKPANLIRRQHDGKVTVIDFGAVKEIRTQLLSAEGDSGLTVGIGTQGYTPPEQLAGKPRYCSDLYALGMTAIQALTGRTPSQIDEDPDTYKPRWEEYANVSAGLSLILNRMVSYNQAQRFQSAEDVLLSLQKLSELPTEITDVTPAMLLPEALLANQPFGALPPRSWRDRLKEAVRLVGITTVAVTGLILGAKQLGWLEPLELRAYDQMVRLRPVPPRDPRLLVVSITEEDLQSLNRATPSDQDLATVIETLQRFQPSAIGVDLHRDLPQEPGNARLQKVLQQENVFSILYLGAPPDVPPTPPPPGVNPDNVGFNDLLIDADGVVRRNLLFATTSTNGTRKTYSSFALRLVTHYLAQRGIAPQSSDRNPKYMELNGVAFPLLRPGAGGYQRVDTAGYQILLDYHSTDQVARQIPFRQVLSGTVDADLVRDRIVLIGTTAPSGRDLFNTPFSAGEENRFKMPGVMVHAQMVSHLLRVTLDQRPLIGVLPEWAEIGWIFCWAGVGAILGWVVRHPIALGLNSVAIILVVVGVGVMVFFNQGWVPVVTPAIALLLAEAVAIAYRSHQSHREQEDLTQLVWQQHRNGTLQ